MKVLNFLVVLLVIWSLISCSKESSIICAGSVKPSYKEILQGKWIADSTFQVNSDSSITAKRADGAYIFVDDTLIVENRYTSKYIFFIDQDTLKYYTLLGDSIIPRQPWIIESIDSIYYQNFDGKFAFMTLKATWMPNFTQTFIKARQ